MLFDSDQDNTDRLKPTSLDIERLENLKTGEYLDGELGNWRVFKYKREYCLLLKKKNDPLRDFDTLDDLYIFLNNFKHENT